MVHHKRDLWPPQGRTNVEQVQVEVTHGPRMKNEIVITVVMTGIVINKNEFSSAECPLSARHNSNCVTCVNQFNSQTTL